jgi:hypothetical protein
VRLAVGDDGVGDSRARRRRRCPEGEREGERFRHGLAGGDRRGLGVIRGRSGGGGTGAAARGGDEDWICLPDDADSGPQWGVLGRTAGDLSLPAACRPNNVNESQARPIVGWYGPIGRASDSFNNYIQKQKKGMSVKS